MAKNTMNIRMFADSASAVFVAPKGTTLPSDFSAPAAGFVEVGWITEDGVAETQSGNVAEFTAWQGSTVVKRKRTQAQKKFTAEFTEENVVTMGLKYRGQVPTITGAAGSKIAKYTFTDQNVTDERAWVIDLLDGAVKHRHVIPAGDYQITGPATASAAGVMSYPVEITVIGDAAYELTNNPAVTGDTTITSY